jgi:hypothetical protein
VSTEIIVALVTAAGIVAAGAIPAIVGARRGQATSQEEGASTRAAVETLGAVLSTRIDGVRDELRADVAELREHITDVRAWQAGHDAEHWLTRPRPEQ